MNPESDKILVKIRRGSIPMVISEYLFKKGGFSCPHINLHPSGSNTWCFSWNKFTFDTPSQERNTKNTFVLKPFSINKKHVFRAIHQPSVPIASFCLVFVSFCLENKKRTKRLHFYRFPIFNPWAFSTHGLVLGIPGNDVTVAFGAEAGQLELNVMEPVIIYKLFSDLEPKKKYIGKVSHIWVEKEILQWCGLSCVCFVYMEELLGMCRL